MKPDGMIVEPEYLAHARGEVARSGAGAALNTLAESEPAMAAFVHESLAAIAGKLVLTGAPSQVVQGSHEDVLAVLLTCVQALRRGHYEIWKDSMVGTRMAQIDEAFQPKPRRKRKKAEGGAAEPESA
jgi:hypothetical protein